ncbi:carboxypeptidase-like regulatory domain-containing protein [Streptomyces sp. NP-1717]|uniref:carboxypeptidase-like regulatory domain-containing protein n=1 Tax=Streptomyces sp. NP-1717 TaxID=2704470 RepID=UPI001F5DAFCC|nr:carboxypeptidase-like regulatory domain-containing protein [Streptomyces sp. NP-1717]MCI3227101.1 carboxypeptidase regulatory-like domain-containing protein [Streptomyces sp. NP-1717]
MEAWARWCHRHRPVVLTLGGRLGRRRPHPAVETPGTAPPAPTPAPTPAQAPKEESVSGATVVHGFVRTEEGAPVTDAVLTLLSPGGEQRDRVVTLADGSYILGVPAGGSYLLAVASREYEPWTRPITVGAEPLVHDLTLSPSGAGSPSRPA